MRMERLHEQMTKMRKMLDNEMIETMTVQIELDKTADDFRRAHMEREELINQWEKTIEQMKKRDQNMDKCANVSIRCSDGLGIYCLVHRARLIGHVQNYTTFNDLV